MYAIDPYPSIAEVAAFECELKRQVEECRYTPDQNTPYEFLTEEDFETWCAAVGAPLSSAIAAESLPDEFPEIGEDELFLRVSLHWYQMRNEGTRSVSAKAAVLDYGSHFAGTANSRFHFQLRKRLL